MIENPHEQRQTMLLARIVKNVDLLNESLEELGRSLAEINVFNEGTAEVAEMWENYRRNAAFNLESATQDAHTE